MIRMKGFAGKTRRATKGGSLSARAGIRDLRNSILRCFSREQSVDAHKKQRLNNVAVSPSSNGAKASANGDAPFSSSADVLPRRNDNVSDFLEKTIAGLVVSGRNGDDYLDVTCDLMELGWVRIPRWKRILDLTCVSLTLPFWLPLMILVMAWIRLASAGPVFYRQERVGHRRDRFMIFKFRTMYVNAETRTHEEYFAHLMRSDSPMTKLDAEGDSRLIAGGRFLRASGLDELPQIFNVISGQMSLVGPRPCLPNEFQRYQGWHQARVNVLPGLTGYWQVNGKNKTTFSEMVAMDLFYANKMSFRLDLTIMLRTVPALFVQTLESLGRNGVDQPISKPAVDQSRNGSVRKI
jgi:lipopolysaccharide/colanic/teichoic acid biosynthesis glycosyltransferase